MNHFSAGFTHALAAIGSFGALVWQCTVEVSIEHFLEHLSVHITSKLAIFGVVGLHLSRFLGSKAADAAGDGVAHLCIGLGVQD